MPKILYQGKIDGEFNGFDDEMVFKMMNGTYWIQARYEYWYHYAYCPDTILTEENGRFNLTVADRSIEVYPLTDVIESRIDGTFEGLQGDSKYRLTNGQVRSLGGRIFICHYFLDNNWCLTLKLDRRFY